MVKSSGRRVPFDRDKLHALARDRVAQAAGRSRARRAHGQRHRAPARKLTARREIPRERIGELVMEGLQRARRRRLCALRLGLPQFPRGHAISTSSSTSSRMAEKPSPGSARHECRREPKRVARARHDPPRGRRFMAAALALGRRGLGPAPPNPAVGALIVTDGVRRRRAAATSRGGRPHAETDALADAGEAARGATLYVTLEPAAIMARRRPAPMRSSRRASRASSRRLKIPIRASPARATRVLRDCRHRGRAGVCAEEARRANLGHILRVTARPPDGDAETRRNRGRFCRRRRAGERACDHRRRRESRACI